MMGILRDVFEVIRYPIANAMLALACFGFFLIAIGDCKLQHTIIEFLGTMFAKMKRRRA